MNTIETATIIQSELDKAAVEQATSGWMEVNEKLVKYTGGAEVKIPSLDMDGMADYDRTNGFVQGSVNFQYETKKMTQDRGRSFSFDENDVDETNFVLTASTVMGEFQRTKVVPEIDAYRYSTIAAACIKKGKASGGYTADEATILQKLYYDIAAVQAIVGQNTPLVITIDSMVAAILSMSEKLSKKLDITDFKQGDVTLKVRSLDGIHPLIPVSSDRMKTEYLFKDGVTSGQEAGGFAPTENSKSMADIFSRIVKGVSKIARTTFFHMGVTVIKLPRLIGRWGHSGIGKYLVRGIKTTEVTDFCNNHGTHTVVDSGDAKNRRINLIHNGFDFGFNFVNLRS